MTDRRLKYIFPNIPLRRDIRQALAVTGYFAIIFLMPHLFDSLAPMLLLPAGFALLWLIFFLKEPSDGRPLSAILAMKRVSSGQPRKIAVGLILALVISAAAAECTRQGLDFLGIPYEKEQELLRILKQSTVTEKIFIGIITSIMAPVCEEIVFRRLIFGRLRSSGTTSALILTSALFAVLHLHLAGILALGLFGAILQILFLKTRNLWCPIQVHIFFNLLTFAGAIIGER